MISPLQKFPPFKKSCSKSQENLTWACQATMSSHSMGCPSDNKPIFKEFFKTHKLILKEFFKTHRLIFKEFFKTCKFTLLQSRAPSEPDVVRGRCGDY